ncbi:hypothetical protein [Trichococcus patagoniensis]|uniref:hypothetical protein n=1 Tax=Trichococcus patagoniensis TaxID=382641 RepID=UPI000D34395A|nr:hypothetical protein [Trichococcus patagoniensis]
MNKIKDEMFKRTKKSEDGQLVDADRLRFCFGLWLAGGGLWPARMDFSLLFIFLSADGIEKMDSFLLFIFIAAFGPEKMDKPQLSIFSDPLVSERLRFCKIKRPNPDWTTYVQSGLGPIHSLFGYAGSPFCD